MFAAQIVMVLSVAMVTGGTLLYNFSEANEVEGVKLAEQEYFWAAGSAALLVPIGSIMFMTAVSLMFLQSRQNSSNSS